MSLARTLRRQQERAERRQAEVPAAAQSTALPPSPAIPSDARLAANRANAQRSTGPRTPEGKARSRQNAVKHGLFSSTLGPAGEKFNENRAEFEALWAEFSEYYDPQGPDEALLVDRIATAWWQLARLGTQTQLQLRRWLDAGVDPLDALAGNEGVGKTEAHVERSLLRMHRNLAFLQKWRRQTVQERERTARRQDEAAYRKWIDADHAETQAVIQDGLRRAHERRDAERAQPEAAAEMEHANAAQDVGAEQADPSVAPDFGSTFEPLDGPEAAPQGAASPTEEPGRSAA